MLRYLPSNLSAPEIAAELCLSTSTVKTHMRHIYAKLDAHRRTEAVERARALGLLGPSVPTPPLASIAHTIRTMRAHPPARDSPAMDDHPAKPVHYEIRIRGVLSETLLAAFPVCTARRRAARPCSPGRCPTRRRSTVCSPRSKRSASSCSKSAVYRKVERPARISRIGRRRLILLDGSLDLTNTKGAGSRDCTG